MSNSPRASSLFHFTNSIDILQSILKDGFWPRYCLEDVQWQGHVNYEFVAYPMVCFCDIPISRIAEHVAFYGSYGIGLTKQWGIKNNLNPVIYFSGDNPVHNAVKSLTGVVNALPDENHKKAGLRHVRYLLAHSKPVNGRMIIAGQPVSKEFYQETEWRFVPQHDDVEDHLLQDIFNDASELGRKNATTSEKCRLKIAPSDIRYIFVPTDADIPSIMNFLQVQLDHLPGADLKVLMSRVTSLESVSNDV
jgi:hypothetical protein